MLDDLCQTVRCNSLEDKSRQLKLVKSSDEELDETKDRSALEKVILV